MTEKRWGEMTADEQVPPWGLLVDTLLLRKQLDTHNAAAAAESHEREGAGGARGGSSHHHRRLSAPFSLRGRMSSSV